MYVCVVDLWFFGVFLFEECVLMVVKKGIVSSKKDKVVWSMSSNWVFFIIGFFGGLALGFVKVVILLD